MSTPPDPCAFIFASGADPVKAISDAAGYIPAVSSTRNPDRLVLFTDAVVAIAITLLVLPLVEVVSQSEAEHATAVEVITEHQPQIYSFLLSFVVIAQLWQAHHRMFEHVKAYNRMLTTWNLLWLLTIVVLPFPTEMVGTYGDDRFTVLFYIGTIFASSTFLSLLTLSIHSNPEVAREPAGLTGPTVMAAITPTLLLGVAFLLAALVPGLHYNALLLLLASPPITWYLRRRHNAPLVVG
jgi:uncharacterized membrane protein